MQLLNIDEAAALLRLDIGTIRNLVRQSKIPYTKPTGKLLFDKSDLEAWVNKAKSTPIGKKEVLHG